MRRKSPRSARRGTQKRLRGSNTLSQRAIREQQASASAELSSAVSALELFFWNDDAEHMQTEFEHIVGCLECDTPAFPGKIALRNANRLTGRETQTDSLHGCAKHRHIIRRATDRKNGSKSCSTLPPTHLQAYYRARHRHNREGFGKGIPPSWRLERGMRVIEALYLRRDQHRYGKRDKRAE